MAEGLVEREIVKQEEYLSDAVEHAVDEAIESARIDRTVEDAVQEAVNDLDLDREVGKAIEHADIPTLIEEEIEELELEIRVRDSFIKFLSRIEIIGPTGIPLRDLTIRMKEEVSSHEEK